MPFGVWPLWAGFGQGARGGGAHVALARLFETITTYNTPAASINLVARRLHVLDFAAFGASVAVNFPAGTLVGECIGISLLTSGAGSDAVTLGTGSVPLFTPLHADSEAALWSWDGTSWQLVSLTTEAPYPFYQLQFNNAALTSGAIDVTHNLDTLAPIVQVYDNAGALVSQDLRYGVNVIDQDGFTLTLSGALLPISGTWTVTVTI